MQNRFVPGLADTPFIALAFGNWRVRRSVHIALGLALVLCLGLCPIAKAQLTTPDKGHSLFLNSGLQIWGSDVDTRYSFNYDIMAQANMNAVMWGFPAIGGSDMSVLSPGQKWARTIDYNSDPTTVLSSAENSHKSDLVALQVGDEQIFNSTKDANYTQTVNLFNQARANNTFPNQLLYINEYALGSAYGNFLADANPDAISFYRYPFSTRAVHYITTRNWLSLALRVGGYGVVC
jgi:hypothetical protein